jgi:Na+-transporting NADH:ubiquinone oxidoreductase subunit NqrB
MNQFKLSLIVCLSLYATIAAATYAMSSTEKLANIGLFGLLLSLFYLLAGIVAVCFVNTRKFGQGMLISAGIVLIIGLAVCSYSPYKFH